ncbi:ribosome assembly cofactor RimP [Acholeplasma granularum]|uniref:ribosome assembly cofactor RimP n=1 Tax=Acholeplasma granularum TaxID=264635 RepID=UPI0004723C31|nr:ribosome assembly cofactor RimP [Acholeplasma granularum]
MNLNIIKEKVNLILKNHDLEIYEILEEKMGKEKILTILIDATLNYEVLEKIHMEVLDSINDDLDDDYYLQLSTVGIERPLRNLEEVQKELGQYIYLESDIYTGNATLDSVIKEDLEISFFLKGRPKKLKVNYSNIRFIRKAIKF